jgi:hypothetical protein
MPGRFDGQAPSWSVRSVPLRALRPLQRIARGSATQLTRAGTPEIGSLRCTSLGFLDALPAFGFPAAVRVSHRRATGTFG